MPDPPRVVFDCNVSLQAAARANSVADQCLQLAETGVIRLIVSRDILAELEDVLNRPEIRVRFPHLSDEVVGAFILRLHKCAELLRHVPKQFRYARDEDDEPYVNLAVAAGADFIISRDKDLLDLMTGYADDCKEFRQRFKPLQVIEPLALLRLHAQHGSQ